MANELSVTLSMTCSNGNFKFNAGDSFSVTQTVAGGGLPGYQVVGTSAETIAVSDLTAPGYVFLKNLDEIAYCEFGVSGTTPAFSPVIRLRAGECALFRLTSGVTFQAKASSATCKIQCYILED